MRTGPAGKPGGDHSGIRNGSYAREKAFRTPPLILRAVRALRKGFFFCILFFEPPKKSMPGLGWSPG